jgi:Nup93/Nic96
LLRTTRLLLNFNAFEKFRAAQKYNEAWKVLEKIDIIPSTQQEIASKQAMYQSLDVLTKEATPSLLSGVMDILYRDYCHFKQQVHADNTGVVRGRLHEIRDKSRLIATFAASAGLPSEQIGNLTTLASLII